MKCLTGRYLISRNTVCIARNMRKGEEICIEANFCICYKTEESYEGIYIKINDAECEEWLKTREDRQNYECLGKLFLLNEEEITD